MQAIEFETWDTYTIRLRGLGSADHIVATRLFSEIDDQLRSQVRGRINRYRYAVEMEIVEGKSRPAKDLDNYAKPILDDFKKWLLKRANRLCLKLFRRKLRLWRKWR